MSPRFLLVSLFGVLSLMSSIGAMDRTIFGDNPDVGIFDVEVMSHLTEQQAQAKSMPCVTLCNKTAHKISILLQFEDTDMFCLTLVPEQTMSLDCTKELLHLEVNLYGHAKQWLTGKKLTAGYYTPENLAGRVVKGISSCGSKHALLTIEPHDDILAGGVIGLFLGSSLPYKIIKSGLSEILPYKCSVSERAAQPEDANSIGKSLLPFFPQVSYARSQRLLLDGLVDPRYILCLPEEELTTYGIKRPIGSYVNIMACCT